MMALDEAHRQTPPQAARKKRERRHEGCGWGRSRHQSLARRDSRAQSCGVGPLEHMQQRNRSDLITRHWQRAPALSCGTGLRRTGLEHGASHAEGHRLLSRSEVLKRPLGAREALTGPQEACGRIRGGRPPRRADRRQQLRQCGQEPSPNGWGRAARGLGVARVQAAAHGARCGRTQPPLAWLRP